MRRVACVALPQIRIEIAKEEPANKAHGPLAVVIARPGGVLKGERDVLGNTRLDVVSKEARALGIHVGQTVAAARAKCACLRVRVVAEHAVRIALARVAEVALAFGPSTSFDVARDVVWIEIGGCAHLHEGELELAQKLEERVRTLGHTCRVSIADGPRIASAIARWTTTPGSAPVIVPSGEGEAAIRSLPIEALELDDDTAVWLRDLGLQTCKDLHALPKRSLGMRLEARTKRATDVMQLLNGEDRTPLDVWRPPEVPEERMELEWGASSVEALGFVVRALCDRLAARLEGRAMATARIALVLTLDRALLAEDVSPTSSIDLALPVAIARAGDLFAVVRTRLDQLELPAPVLAVTLRTLELSVAHARPLDLLALLAPERDGRPRSARTGSPLALAPLVAELVAELGPSRVGTLALVDTWSPDERTRLVPFASTFASDAHAASRDRSTAGLEGIAEELAGARATGAHAADPIEPSRVVHPFRRPLESFDPPVLLARYEAIEWWRRAAQRRDFCAAWDGANIAWVELGPHRGGDASSSKRPEAQVGQVWVHGWLD